MARRLQESQKHNLVEGYRLGESTTSLAEKYGCSQNTVIRTVKTYLSTEEYQALKVARSKGDVAQSNCDDKAVELINHANSKKEIALENQFNESIFTIFICDIFRQILHYIFVI